ncbi:MAG: EVE domain-containing protein [Haliea sp.]|uniref:EVE domain-containing protein n=1 Tax=Haliea sp. TaxID=1932666 RepID=UPI0032ED6AEA
MACWLLKTEPDTFSIDDLASRPGQTEPWDGVRNYQARNFIRDGMRVGDEVLVYHSSCAVPGVVGLARVAGKPRPDPTQFDPESPYFDPGSDPDHPRWVLVDVRYLRHLPRPVTLAELKQHADALDGLALLRRSRLSVMPVSEAQRDFILALAGDGSAKA